MEKKEKKRKEKKRKKYFCFHLFVEGALNIAKYHQEYFERKRKRRERFERNAFSDSSDSPSFSIQIGNASKKIPSFVIQDIHGPKDKKKRKEKKERISVSISICWLRVRVKYCQISLRISWRGRGRGGKDSKRDMLFALHLPPTPPLSHFKLKTHRRKFHRSLHRITNQRIKRKKKKKKKRARGFLFRNMQ